MFCFSVIQNKMVLHYSVRYQACQHDEDGICSGEWIRDPVLWPCLCVLGLFTCHTLSTPASLLTWIEQFGRYDLFSNWKGSWKKTVTWLIFCSMQFVALSSSVHVFCNVSHSPMSLVPLFDYWTNKPSIVLDYYFRNNVALSKAGVKYYKKCEISVFMIWVIAVLIRGEDCMMFTGVTELIIP
jgi:hypothetical protein